MFGARTLISVEHFTMSVSMSIADIVVKARPRSIYLKQTTLNEGKVLKHRIRGPRFLSYSTFVDLRA